MPAKKDEEIPWNKLSVDLIFPFIVCRKLKKEHLNLKSITMIDPVTGWFKIMEYNNKHTIKIANLVEATWLTRYHWPMEIMYDQGS